MVDSEPRVAYEQPEMEDEDCYHAMKVTADHPHYFSNDQHSVRAMCQTLVGNLFFKRCIIVLIILNSLQMGVATYDFVHDNLAIFQAFEVADLVFLILFTIEIGLQIIARGLYEVTVSNGWLAFDFWVISLSWAFGGLSIIRSFRIVRAARLVARIDELQDLVTALVNVIPKMFAIFILMLLVFYVFGVMMTQLFRDAYRDGITEDDLFSNLQTTLFTLFQLSTLENWSGITRDLMQVYSWAWIPMMTFVLISSFIVINLVIAVICDAVAKLHSNDGAGSTRQLLSSPSKNETTISDLEAKVDRLTSLVEELLRAQKQGSAC